ncbi:MAG: DUF2339 domain-containing protein, partial [Robiginitomaculum sp.]|nr:DUF2339 domain-containing protein [Robiginitomaculum sp.]
RIGKLELQIKRLQNQLRGAPDITPAPSMRPEAPSKTERDKAHLREAKRVAATKPSREPVLTAKTSYQPALKQTKPTKPLKPKRAKRSFEEEIGARWAVWVGGIALAFGAIFLLRYTIEAGVFSPAMRIALAALMGVVLLGAGEFLRRVDGKNIKLPEALAGLNQTAYIPGVLTAVGIFTLLGTSYAAYELYNFIGPLVTFAMLAVISLAALALSLLHGPKMAALGLVASMLTPLLIDMGTPNFFVLYTYLIVVSIAALALARLRDWPWLNVLTLFGALGWSYMSFDAADKNITYGAWLIFTGVMFALSTLIARIYDKEQSNIIPTNRIRHNNVAACTWSLFAALLFLGIAGNQPGFHCPHAHMAIGFGFVLMVVGWHIPRQSANIIIGGALSAFAVWFGASNDLGFTQSLVFGAATALSVTGWGFLKARQSTDKPYQQLWSFFGAALPIALSLGFDSELTGFSSKLTSTVLFTFVIINALLAYRLHTKSNNGNEAVKIYTIAAAIAYTFATLIGFSGLAETILLMAGIAISAGIYSRTAIPALRWVSAGFALLSAAYTLFIRIGENGTLSERLIINELWVYFALPALLCAAAAWLLSRKYDDIWSEGLKALTLTFAALFFVFQIRHFMNGGNVLAAEFGFDEMALQVMVGLSFTLGGTILGRTNKPKDVKREPYERLIPGLATAVSLATLALFVFGICFAYNPLLTNNTVIKGGGVINSLLLAYLLPALALAAITWLSRSHRPRAYIQATGALSLVAFMLYLTTMVRVLFTGDKISLWATSFKDAELYAISAVWLVFGIILLVAGLKLKQKDIRTASALVITLTVLKAFLIDMASLEGVLRAMSFVVLGLVLIVIGRVYQKLLFSQKNAEE